MLTQCLMKTESTFGCFNWNADTPTLSVSLKCS